MSTAKSNGKHADRSHTCGTSVVCGGAGFLGSHLCARLLDEGRQVVCVDNFSTSELEAIEPLLSHPRFELIKKDVSLLTKEEVSHANRIYNLACAASPVRYQRDPLDTLFSSVHGMDNVLRIARATGARVFQASTSEIYGHPTVHPQPETYWGYCNPVGPRACYDEGKRCAETLCLIHQEQFGTAVRIARIFNTYGPGMHVGDGRVIINFIVQALADEPITVYGDGSQTRSFCYVDDLIDGIERLMNMPGQRVGPINLGNPAEIPVRNLAQRVVQLTGSKSYIVVKPLPIDDPPRRRPDITLARQVLHWQPRIDLDTGLRLTIADVRRRQLAAAAILRPGELPAMARSSLAGVNVL